MFIYPRTHLTTDVLIKKTVLPDKRSIADSTLLFSSVFFVVVLFWFLALFCFSWVGRHLSSHLTILVFYRTIQTHICNRKVKLLVIVHFVFSQVICLVSIWDRISYMWFIRPYKGNKTISSQHSTDWTGSMVEKSYVYIQGVCVFS